MLHDTPRRDLELNELEIRVGICSTGWNMSSVMRNKVYTYIPNIYIDKNTH